MATRDKILVLAEHLLHKHGYIGFSYADISHELGIKNAAIHYHFPTKATLAVEVIQTVSKRFEHWEKHLNEHNTSDWNVLEKFFQVYDNNCYTEQRMCLVSSLCSDYSQLPGEVQSELNDLMIKLKKWLTNALDNGRRHGSFDFEGAPETRASMILTCLMGGLLVNRAQGSATYENIKNQLIKDIHHAN